MKLLPIKKGTNAMSNKKTKTNNNLKAADKLLTFLAQVILVVALIEPIMTTDNEILRGVVGAAVAYISINLAVFTYKHIIKPSAKAIISNAQ